MQNRYRTNSLQEAREALLCLHLETPVLFRGAPQSRVIGNTIYWYDKYRIGNRVMADYLGPQTDALLERVTAYRRHREEAGALQFQMSGLSRRLMAAGDPRPGRVMGALLAGLQRAGMLDEQAVLLGPQGWAAAAAGAGLHPAAGIATPDPSLLRLARPGMSRHFPVLASQLASHEAWRQVALDVWTPASNVADPGQSTRQPGRSLPESSFLLRDPQPAVLLYGTGLLVFVPRPERFAIWELVAAQAPELIPSASGYPAPLARRHALDLINQLMEDHQESFMALWQEVCDSRPDWSAALEREADAQPELAEIVLSFRERGPFSASMPHQTESDAVVCLEDMAPPEPFA